MYEHFIGSAFREAEHLPLVKRGRNPFVAFTVGFLFGPIGSGIYLRSWIDLVIPLMLILVGSFLTVGLGLPFFWMLSGAWAAWRVRLANAISQTT